ncbi:MAG: hypothetical protein ACRDTJ_16455 [Pseudonocardiaceae bacterium]
MPKKRDPRAGGKIKPLTDREKFNAEKSTRGLSKGHWEVIGGKRVWVKD